VIRHHAISGEPLILAPERAGRPNDFDDAPSICPFCPGNEHETPPEVARVGEPWRLRVFPNKYPATAHHEVIVESPHHGAAFHDLAPSDAEAAVRLYADRYRVMRDADGVRGVSLFKNHGRQAGASLAHLHSQILATPFVPLRVSREMDGFARADACPLCAIPGVVIAEDDSFVWLAPHASAMPYLSWLVPRVHAPELVPLTDAAALARLLARASRAAARLRGAFNWMFLNFPMTSGAAAPKAHWYVEVVPRVTALAGFELGSGSAINVVSPEEAARYLQGPA
jgi:UDPglucose--hexose-1-phosphate uridylyltransferase